MHRLALSHPAAAESENAVDERLPTRARLHHLIDLAAHGAAFAQAVLHEFAETENRAQDVVEVVRDATGQAPDRLHLGRLLQLPLQLLALLFLHSLRLLRTFAAGGGPHPPAKIPPPRFFRERTSHQLEMLD